MGKKILNAMFVSWTIIVAEISGFVLEKLKNWGILDTIKAYAGI